MSWYIILVVVLFIVISLYVRNQNLKKEIKLIKENAKKSKAAFEKGSRSAIRGQAIETVVPIIPNFPYNPSDCRFIGSPIDYIVFKNLSAVRDGEELLVEVILAEVKDNKSKMTKIQKAVKEAIDSGRVSFQNWQFIDNQLNIK